MKIHTLFASSLLFLSICSDVSAISYTMPPTPGDTVVTEHSDGVALTQVEQDETLLDVARRFLLGQVEIVRLNQDLDRWKINKGQIVRLPNRRILPDAPHNGIVLNISEYRMFYYPSNQPGTVMSFAHGVGRQDWKTPLGKTSVAKKVKNPSWHPPESIRREHAAMGDPLPEVVPPGPHNPLGAYALHLNLPGEYRIHGTDIDKIFGIGMQITHGCVRMYPEDIETLYQYVDVGTPVYLVKQPIKVGWLDNTLYIEAHPDLEGDEMSQEQRYAMALSLIQKATKEEMPDFDQQALNKALKNLDGDPVPLYERLPPIEELPTVDEASSQAETLPEKEQKKQPKVSSAKPEKKQNKKQPAVATVKQEKKQDKKTTKKQVSAGGYYRGS